jgi:death-on-curing protein
VTPDDPEFLSVEDVLELHALQLARYGGGAGLRDPGRLDAAVAQARATFDGEFVHGDLFAMAAAYLFHIIQNHPFVDGNKRTGLLASLVFLDLNGLSVIQESETLYELTLGVAEGRIEKREVAVTLRRICQGSTG